MLQNNPALKAKIEQLLNKFWAGSIANPLTAIEQITYGGTEDAQKVAFRTGIK